MGYGAYMSIVNQSANPVTVFVGTQTCMYDNGDDGSELSLFNNVTVPAGEQFPVNGSGIYIEAKSSGECGLQPSKFGLSFSVGAAFTFTESDSNWSTIDHSNLVSVEINNEQAHATIEIAILP
jgi:hypothetical protein